MLELSLNFLGSNQANGLFLLTEREASPEARGDGKPEILTLNPISKW